MQVGRHSRRIEEGGLHGAWLKVLGVVSLAAVVVAVWQLTASSRGDAPPPSGGGEVSSMEISPAPETMVADSSPSPSESPSADPSPSVSPSPSPEPSAEAESSEPPPEEATEAATTAAEPSCSATLRLDHSWHGNVQVAVVVSASGGAAIDGWEVDLGIDGVDIDRYWNMSHHRGDDYRDDGWNARLAPGEETEAAFQAEVDRHYELPDSVPCEPLD